MTKNDIINEIIAETSTYMTTDQTDQLKVTMLVKFRGFELTEMETLPCVIVYDNQWLMTRFKIDMLAKGLSEKTIEGYIGRVKSFFDETGLNYREVTGQHITDYLAIRQYKDHISQSYKSTIWRYLSAFFGWAYRKKHIETDIMLDVDHIKQPQKKKDRLTDREIDVCRFMCTNPREKALFELMMSTGMRVAEISRLNIKYVDFQEKTISIFGKGSKYRTGYLNDRAYDSLKKYIESRRDKSEALFVCSVTSKAAGRRMSNAKLQEMAKHIGRNAHLKTTVHVYRKTFATNMYRATDDVLFVSKLLGHASTDVTIKCYLVDDIENMKYKHRKAA